MVGPTSNPANLNATSDSILTMFNKIVTVGNEDVAVSFPIPSALEQDTFNFILSYFRHLQLHALRPASFPAMTKVPPISRNLNFSLQSVKYVLHSMFPFAAGAEPLTRIGTLGTRLLQMVPPISTFPSSSARSCLCSL